MNQITASQAGTSEPTRTPPVSGTMESAPGLDFRTLWQIAKTQWLIVLVITGLCVAAAIMVTLFQTPLYTASATLQIDDNAAPVLDSDSENMVTNSSTETDRFLNTQLDILRSKKLALQVTDKLNLSADPAFFEAMQVPAEKVPTGRNARAAAANMLSSRLLLSIPRQSRIATVAVETATPEYSARIANTYADEFIASNLQQKYDSSSYARDFLAEQLAEARDRLEQSETALNAYAANAGITRLGSQQNNGGGDVGLTTVTTESLLQLNQAANAARSRRIEAESRWRTVSNSDSLSDSSVQSSQAVQTLLSNRAQVAAELQDELTRHLPEHPSVKALEARRDALTGQLNRVVSGIRQGVRSEYESALAAERALQTQVSRLQQATEGEQRSGVQYSVLQREAQTNRALYDALLQRFNEVTAASGLSTSNIALLDRAVAPGVPSSPNPLLNLAYGIFVGLLLSGLIVLVRLQLSDRIDVPEDLQRTTDLRLLGIIPHNRDVITAVQNPKSNVYEAYASLRTSLSFANGGDPKQLLVTSVEPSEGKSTTSITLAFNLAQEYERVLLLDADLRKPSLHRNFRMDNERGLSNILEGNGVLEELVQQVKGQRFDVLTAGPLPANPSQATTGVALRNFIAGLNDKYDVVIVDGPPVLGLADAPALASILSATLMVVESGRHRPRALNQALTRLRLAGANVLGATLTKFDARKSGADGYGYGYEYYAYGDKVPKSERSSATS